MLSGQENALAVNLLLLTCARIGEPAKAEWTHINFDGAEWVVPDSVSKTGKGFTVPLSPAALEGLQADNGAAHRLRLRAA